MVQVLTDSPTERSHGGRFGCGFIINDVLLPIDDGHAIHLTSTEHRQAELRHLDFPLVSLLVDPFAVPQPEARLLLPLQCCDHRHCLVHVGGANNVSVLIASLPQLHLGFALLGTEVGRAIRWGFRFHNELLVEDGLLKDGTVDEPTKGHCCR